MATEQYLLLAVSSGVMKEKGKEPMPYASVEVANAKARDTSNDERVTYGSPVMKLKLIQEENGLPNLDLGRRLAEANLYGQLVTFEGVFELLKVKGVPQMTFTILDAQIPTKAPATFPGKVA